MKLTRWMPWYCRIASTFGYSIEKDREATTVLSRLLSEVASPLAGLKRLIEGKDVIIFGAGPSLEKNLSMLASTQQHGIFTLIAADGATTAFLRESITPHIIVTDLDGHMDDIMKACRLGSAVVVHAHGDNIEALRKWVPTIIENSKGGVYGTTQVEPCPPVIYNFGGFTDGDRGAFLAEEMGAKTIVLGGMDLGQTIGEYSKYRPAVSHVPQDEMKRVSSKIMKLRFAKELLEWLATWSRARGKLFNATGPAGEMIKGFKDIGFEDIPRIVRLRKNESKA